MVTRLSVSKVLKSIRIGETRFKARGKMRGEDVIAFVVNDYASTIHHQMLFNTIIEISTWQLFHLLIIHIPVPRSQLQHPACIPRSGMRGDGHHFHWLTLYSWAL